MSKRREGGRSILQWIASGLKWLGLAVSVAIALAAAVILAAGLTAPDRRQLMTPGGVRQDASFYLRAEDGVHLAVSVIMPADYQGGEIPALVHMTRYWRGLEPTFLNRALSRLGIGRDASAPQEPFASFLSQAGYALVIVDSRGTGASEGEWATLFGREETADFNVVFDWIVAQPWSNGRIGTWGISYPGFTSELAAAERHPALRAIAPSFVYWDVTGDAITEGGVRNDWLVDTWSAFTERLDHNNLCDGDDQLCPLLQSLMVKGVRRVDDDRDGERLRRILSERHNVTVHDGLQDYAFEGDLYRGYDQSLDAITPQARAEDLEASGVAYYVMTGWYDNGGADGALRRYLSIANSQDVIIGPWSHGGRHHTDPFLPPDAPAPMTREQLAGRLIAFFDRHLKTDGTVPNERRIVYYVNGAELWRTTTMWPPEGLASQRYYFTAGGSLQEESPREAAGADNYQVNFSASTGEHTRAMTTLGGGDVIYPDRAEEDGRLLSYTSSPLDRDIEITGNPVLHLALASSAADGAVFVYLEDVDPSGRVTYLTEGKRRLIFQADNPAARLAPEPLLTRAASRALEPNEVATINIPLDAVSALVRAGHRIRLSIAGHDASGYRRYPSTGEVVFSIQRNAVSPSYLDLPARPFDPSAGTASPPP